MASRTVHLTATYTNLSPCSTNATSEPETVTLSAIPLSLPTGNDMTVESKTEYLASLRAATIAIQENINAELTRRMEEDVKNAAAAVAAGVGVGQEAPALNAKRNNKQKKGKGKNVAEGAVDAPVVVVDEVREEENYGEEVPEDADDI